MPNIVSRLDEADSFQIHDLQRRGVGPIVPLAREIDSFSRENISRGLREVCGGETTREAVLEFVFYLSMELADAKEFLKKRNLGITLTAK